MLRGIALFADLPPGQIDMLARGACVRQLARGLIIYRSGETASEVHCVLSGHVKRTTEPQGNDDTVLDLIYPGQMFGETELIAGRPRISFAIAAETTRLLCIGSKTFSELLQSTPQLSTRLLAGLARRQLEMESDTLASRSMDGHQRLLDYLLQQSGGLSARDQETQLYLPSTKRLIAARLGMTPETFSRCLRSLAEDDLLTVQGRTIRLQNTAIRHHLAQGTHHPGRSLESFNLPQASSPGHLPSEPDKAASLPLSRTLPAAINKAGRLRMLSQRMAKCWLMIARRVAPIRARKMLQDSIRAFDTLLSEIEALEIAPEARACLATILELWPDYRALLDTPPGADNTRTARAFFQLSEKLLIATNALTLALEQTLNTPENHLINLAGRERMLSQRMAKFFMFLDWQPTGINRAKCREELHRSMREFENALTMLTREIRNQPEIQHQLVAVADQWRQMRSVLDMTDKRADNQEIHRQTGAVCSFSERLLKKMDTAVALYEKKLTA